MNATTAPILSYMYKNILWTFYFDRGFIAKYTIRLDFNSSKVINYYADTKLTWRLKIRTLEVTEKEDGLAAKFHGNNNKQRKKRDHGNLLRQDTHIWKIPGNAPYRFYYL